AVLELHWQKKGLKPNPPAADETFLRRVYLDVIGRIPTLAESRSFLADTGEDKRARLIDCLLASDGYALHGFNYWADVLRAQSQLTRRGHHAVFCDLIRDALRTNKPYDQWVREMLSARGDLFNVPGTAFYLRDTGMPLDNLANLTRIFLGTRIECAQCHNHPFDKWTQMDFYRMAAFTHGNEFSHWKKIPLFRAALDKVGPYKGPERPKMGITIENALSPQTYTGMVWTGLPLKLPHDYQYADAKPHDEIKPAVMFGQSPPSATGEANLDAFAAWATSPENPRFTTVVVNRLWKRLFGLANIEPLDELMDSSTPVIPALQTELESYMKALRYDLKAFLRTLLNTRAYQAECVRAEIAAGDTSHFIGPLLRRMTAEQAWDSLITLINPAPDLRNRITHDYLERRRAIDRDNVLAQRLMTPDEVFEGVKAAAGTYVRNAQTVQRLQKELEAARAADDKDLAKKIGLQMTTVENNQRDAVRTHILIPAARKLAEKEKRPVAHLDGPQAGLQNSERLEQVWDEHRDASKWQDILHPEMQRHSIPQSSRETFIKNRLSIFTTYLRASELDQPAPGGHFLREFGQSDREVIENASTDASITQALQMMNSSLIPRVLDPSNALMLALYNEPDRVEGIYLALLARKPTDTEKARLKDTSTEDLVFALLNGQQFLFVQ
ncbi:MAG: DUF1549 domain-containing protein, partial [Prosthecobacter sp.]